MAEIFTTDTNTQAKIDVYKFACEAIMNLLRAEVLAVVGTTKTDLRASLVDENIEIETLLDPTMGINGTVPGYSEVLFCRFWII
eukprot:COSAG02_NODE_15488_length_1163_cov_1.544517_1_plen_84_part_00